MINPKLHLQAPKEANEGEFPILLLFSVNGNRIQYYTGIRMPKKFHVKGGKYPFSNKWQDAPAAKIKLDSMIRHAYTIESEFIKSGAEQSVALFRSELDKKCKGRNAIVKKTQSIDDVINEFLMHVKTDLAYNTHRSSQTVLNLFKGYLSSKVFKLGVGDISEEIIEGFKEHIRDGRLNNTVVKSMQILRTFLQWCVKKKYLTSIPTVETGSPNSITVVHLTYEQVMKIAYAPMPSLTLEKVRDFFLFGCFTGMRYGDIAGLKKNNVFKDHLKFFNQKNASTQSITVPLTPVSLGILKKYKDLKGDYALPSISNQKTNDYLKEVGRVAGLNDKVVIAEKDAFGEIDTTEYELHELLTCHVTRKSFITIAMTLGMQESTIISITGHSKGSKAFHKYYDVVDSVKFSQMNKIFNN